MLHTRREDIVKSALIKVVLATCFFSLENHHSRGGFHYGLHWLHHESVSWHRRERGLIPDTAFVVASGPG